MVLLLISITDNTSHGAQVLSFRLIPKPNPKTKTNVGKCEWGISSALVLPT